MLSNHDSESSQVGTANSGDGEELSESSDVVGLANELVLNVQLGRDVVDVSGDLDGVVAENDKGLPGLSVTTLLHVPSGRFGAQVDEAEKRDSGKERRAKHQTPVDILYVVDGQVKGTSEQNTKGSPHF